MDAAVRKSTCGHLLAMESEANYVTNLLGVSVSSSLKWG